MGNKIRPDGMTQRKPRASTATVGYLDFWIRHAEKALDSIPHRGDESSRDYRNNMRSYWKNVIAGLCWVRAHAMQEIERRKLKQG